MIAASTRDETLRELLENNFSLAKKFRKLAELFEDKPLKQYFQNQAGLRSKFAIELAEEIAFYGGKAPYIPANAYQRVRNLEAKPEKKSLKKIIKKNKESLQKYNLALCSIYEGSSREILIRHRASIENSVYELSSLLKLLKPKEKFTTASAGKERFI